MSHAFLGESAAFIGRARLRGPAVERVEGRLALERVTGRMDIRLPRSSPASILVMRRLSCRLRAPPKIAADDMRAVQALGRSAQQAIDDASIRAVRATQGASANRADAVYFQDFAEFMSCLARDWLAGDTGSRWWWRAVLGNASVEATLLDYCRRRPESLPSMLEKLAATSDAERFVAALRPADARALIHAISETFALECDIDALISSTHAFPARAEPPHAQLRRIRAALPELTRSSLDRPAMLLLALGLGLRRVPAATRSPAFAEFVQRSFETTAHARDAPDSPASMASPALHDPKAIAVIDERRDARGTLQDGGPDDDEVVAVQARVSSAGQRDAASRTDAPVAEPVKDERPPLTRDDFARVDGDPLVVTAPPPRPVDTDTVGLAPFEDDAGDLACGTRFGGIFYILNVALHMGFYGDFTQPRARGLAVSPWDFLAVCGRTWFRKRFVADPVWRLLARLAGRDPDEDPSEDLDPECLPRMEARIALALGERRTRRAVMRLVLADARVVDTGTHVDVHLDLAKLPLPVRYAGLDRDPGWIPAAGRIVAFHFD